MIGRFVDYYAILHLPATASPQEIEAALGAEAARLQEDDALSQTDGDERLRLLYRARMVLCDEQNRMMYDIMGKDVSADVTWGVPDHPQASPVSSPPPAATAAELPPEPQPVSVPVIPPTAPVAPASDQPKTQRELDAEIELKRLDAELQIRAERLQRKADEGKPFYRSRFGCLIIISLTVTVVSGIFSLIASYMNR